MIASRVAALVPAALALLCSPMPRSTLLARAPRPCVQAYVGSTSSGPSPLSQLTPASRPRAYGEQWTQLSPWPSPAGLLVGPALAHAHAQSSLSAVPPTAPLASCTPPCPALCCPSMPPSSSSLPGLGPALALPSSPFFALVSSPWSPVVACFVFVVRLLSFLCSPFASSHLSPLCPPRSLHDRFACRRPCARRARPAMQPQAPLHHVGARPTSMRAGIRWLNEHRLFPFLPANPSKPTARVWLAVDTAFPLAFARRSLGLPRPWKTFGKKKTM